MGRRTRLPDAHDLAGLHALRVAAGVESMSRVPTGSSVLPGSNPFGESMTQRYAEGLMPQGISAELIAARWGFLRIELDEFSAASHEKAAQATKEGVFDNELAPIAGLATDEIIRCTTAQSEHAGAAPMSSRTALFGTDMTTNKRRSRVVPTDAPRGGRWLLAAGGIGAAGEQRVMASFVGVVS